MGSLHIEVVKLLVCFTLSIRLMAVVINAESTDFILDKLKTSIDNIKTTVDDVLTISEGLNSLDNTGKKLYLLETLTEHMYSVAKRIVSFVEFNQEMSFQEMKKTGLKVMNLVSKIYTVVENIRLNPGSLPEYSVIIATSAEEILTLVHHFNVIIFKEDLKKSKYESNTAETFDSIATPSSEYEISKKEGRVRFKEAVSVYEYSEEDEILDSATTVRKCSLNDETEGFCSKEEFLAEDFTKDVCKSYVKPSLKTHSSYEKELLDSCVNSKDTEEEQCIVDTCLNENGYSESREDTKRTSGTEDSAKSSSLGNDNDEKLISEDFISNEILSNLRQCSDAAEGDEQCAQVTGVKSSENTPYTLHETYNKANVFVCSSNNKPECGNSEHHLLDEDSCLSREYKGTYTTSTEDSVTSETHEEPTIYEEPITRDNNIMSETENVLEDNADENENIRYEDSSAEIIITTESSSSQDIYENSKITATTEDYKTIETYTNVYEDSTTTDSSSVYNDNGYSSDYTTTEETTTEIYGSSYDTYTTESPSYYGSDSYSEPTTTTTERNGYSYNTYTTESPSYYGSDSYSETTTTTTECYGHSDDAYTTESPSYYGSDSYSEPTTTTEQVETTTERDLSSLSQNIYSVAQDLSTKAQEISTVTSEISTKVSEISSALSDINTDDQDVQNKIQELSKLTQEISSKTSEISTLSSETSRLASDISTASNDIPNVNNKEHPHRISPRQRITGKSQDLITSTQNIITAAQDVIVKIQDLSFRSYDLSKADMISTASHDITSRTQGIITEALDIVTAALEIMTSVDF